MKEQAHEQMVFLAVSFPYNLYSTTRVVNSDGPMMPSNSRDSKPAQGKLVMSTDA